MPSDGELKTFENIVAEERRVLRGDASPLTALCISGGGIRSATFALGALQGLADQGVLGDFDYLSTVSGGGYIGGWLTSWKHRRNGLDNILPKLRSGAPLPKPGELDPIGHLRDYNNYLSPRMGFFSADTWTLAATVFRNMTLNWLVLVPLLMFALMAPRLILALAILHDNFKYFYGVEMSPLTDYPLRIVSGFFFAAAIFNTMRYLPGVGGENCTQKDFLKYCLAPIILAAIGFMTWDAWFDPYLNDVSPPPAYWVMVLWFTVSCAFGWVGYLVFRVRGLMKRLRLLVGNLSLAILLIGVCTASAAWLLVITVYKYPGWPDYVTFGPPLLLLSFMVAGGLFVGLTSRILGDGDREWLARGAAWMLLFVVCWAAICGVVLMGPILVFRLNAWLKSSVAAAGGLAGWICSKAGSASQSITKKGPGLDLVSKLAAPVFVVALLAGLAILTNWLMAEAGTLAPSLVLAPASWSSPDQNFLAFSRPELILAGALAFVIFGSIAAHYININKFSLHAMYRNRLIRAYLGASNADRSRPDLFTGFTDTDNIQMSDLNPALKPFHVLNMTLNLVAGKRLAWQQRKAESFTVSPLHAGSSRLSYRPSGEYGGHEGGKDGISLGTAIAISGAAASPNMGYHSSGVIGFIMTLFNARLGAWLGNPGETGGTSKTLAFTRWSCGAAGRSSFWIRAATRSSSTRISATRCAKFGSTWDIPSISTMPPSSACASATSAGLSPRSAIRP